MVDLMGPQWIVHVPKQALEWNMLVIQYLVLDLLNVNLLATPLTLSR